MWFIDSGFYKIFQYIPFQIAVIIVIDVSVSFARKDYYAKWIMKWYVKEILRNISGKNRYISD